MSKLIVLSVGQGSFAHGFPVTLHIGEEGHPPFAHWQGRLPAAPELPRIYQRWQAMYYHLGKLRWGLRITVPPGQITNVATMGSCEQLADELQADLQAWFAQPDLQALQLEILDRVQADEPARLILQTRDRLLRRIPWHLWQLFDRRPQAELALYSESTSDSASTTNAPLRAPVNVLAILGHAEGLDLQADWAALSKLPQTRIQLLEQPTLQQVSEQLWQRPWDVLFFAGHSIDGANGGQIQLNASDAMPLEQLRYALGAAVKNGLKLAVFNSCDGLGLTQVLEEARVPQSVIMREPVPDRVAQTFLRYFLERLADGQPLHVAMRQAREQLQWLEDQFPCATWLPVICQSPAAIAPLWPTHGNAPEPPSHRQVPLVVPGQPKHHNPRTTHCINPECTRPSPHRWTDLTCPTCQGPLRLNQRYVPLNCLSSSRYLETFEVYDLKTHRTALLQVLKMADAEAIAQFKEETTQLSQIRDRGIPRVHDANFTVDLPRVCRLTCRVLDPVPGYSLQQILEKHPQGCPADWVLDWLKQATALLQLLHSHHIVHRNLTPANLIVRQDTQRLAVIGFGGKPRGSSKHLQRLPEHVPPTLVYHPPEQIRQFPVPPGVDCYALGMIAIHLLTGHHPSEFRNPATGILEWQPPRLPPALIDLLDALVHPDSSQRIQTANSLQSQLLPIMIKPSARPKPVAVPTKSPANAVMPTRQPGMAQPMATHPADRSTARSTARSTTRSTTRSTAQSTTRSTERSPSRTATRSSGRSLATATAHPLAAMHQAVTSGLNLGDQGIAAFVQALETLWVGALASGVVGGLSAAVLYASPMGPVLQAALVHWPISAANLVFALATLATAWSLATCSWIEASPRAWLTGGLTLLAYSLVWSVLPHATPFHGLGTQALLLAFVLLLSLGHYRQLWLKALVVVVGLLVGLALLRQSGLLVLSQQPLLAVPSPNVLAPVALLRSLGLLAMLGGLTGFWLSLGQSFARFWRYR
jgi:serine/threonine protein kinase